MVQRSWLAAVVYRLLGGHWTRSPHLCVHERGGEGGRGGGREGGR